jgi:hypothetical protein
MPESDSIPSIEDPEELVNRLRIESIMGIRNKIHDKRLVVKQTQNENKMAAVSGYRSLIESYVLEIASLFEVYETGRELLESKEYGVVEISKESLIIEKRQSASPSPTKLAKLRLDSHYENPDQYYLANNTYDWDRGQEIQGLYSVLELDDPITFSYSLIKSNGWGPKGAKVTETASTQIPLKILDQMLIDMNSFLASIGFELDPMIELESPEI